MSGNAMNQFTERAEVLDTLAPTAANAAVGTHQTSCVDLEEFHRAFIMINLGEAAQGATIDVTVWQAKNTSCADAKQMTSKAPAQIVAGDQGGYVGIEIQSEELDLNNSYHCIKVRCVVGSDTYYHSVEIFGLDSRFEPRDTSGFTELVE